MHTSKSKKPEAPQQIRYSRTSHDGHPPCSLSRSNSTRDDPADKLVNFSNSDRILSKSIVAFRTYLLMNK
ncbi:MAG: hypothetical protein QNJ72_21520 [Pleurocapsa sp. MO_226.B13]|nr:hypothetical protein [Pleurocapsa sp. MO_226.B13]